MFLGDHVMMEMTSNVVPWPGQGDMLARYLDSLQKIYAMPEMRRAYCSHGTLTDQPYPAARIRKRIAWIRRHYLRRIDEVVQALDAHPGMDGMEIASYIKWNIPFANLGDASMMQQTFIIGETMAYVEYALNRGRITREADGAVNRYFADVVKKG
jgi:glyoxylase-like metal-dependent hydrolase (beta-lactamase superfamily II)